MKKNILTKILALTLCACTAVPMAACGGIQGEKVDETKTQLHLFHFFGGYGDAWVNELADNFEKKVEGISFETGKTGVQIHIDGNMDKWSFETFKSQQYDVFFLEDSSYMYAAMTQGALEPLDSIMTVANPDDNNQTIESKLAKQVKDAYTYNGHSYALPWYLGNYGIIYNKDLFDEKGFYLAAEPDDEGNLLISETNPTKSAGPDGKTGVIDGVDYSLDDGLPATYDEFFELCIEINAYNIDPICFPGRYRDQHVSFLLDNLAAMHEGAEQMSLNYTFSGEATNLIKIEDGEIVYDEKGNPVTESLEINKDNAYNLSRQEGKYYAMSFIERLLNNPDYYNETDGFNDTVSHLENQQKFLENESRGERTSAMLIDGVWWQAEASPVFERMAKNNSKYSKDNRNFGWMPLPQATKEEAAKMAAGEKNLTFNDWLNAATCVKSGLSDGVKNAALEFVKYAYSDEALTNFTYTTGTVVGVDYLDAVDTSKLNYYENSIVDFFKKADIVYQVSNNSFYMSNIASFRPADVYTTQGFTYIVDAIDEGGMSGLEYFIGNQRAYKGIAWNN